MAGILLNLLAATDGGQLTRAEAFLRRFRQHNRESRLVIVKECDALPFCHGVDNGEVVNVMIGAGGLKALRRMAWESTVLPRLMRKKDLNIYLTFSHYLPLGLEARIRSIVGVSNLAPFSSEAWSVESHAVRLKMRLLRHTIVSSAKRADKVIALSAACKRILVAEGVRDSKVEVIPNGVDVGGSPFDPVTTSDSPYPFPYILSVSHFHRYKNFEQVVEAYSLLPQALQDRFSLVIVGKPYDAKYYAEINGLIARLKLGEHVHLVPGLDRTALNTHYRHASLFVFPSLIENSPNILLEAMAHGLPILACHVDPMPEYGTNAIGYFEVFSSRDLGSKMEGFLSNPDESTCFRHLARTRAKDFSWDMFTARVLALCASVSVPPAGIQEECSK
jgi:glycosyltransferase involved in cell wall biosynthesis